jgi:glucoamylase
MADQTRYAPGWPGIAPRWTSSAKTGVGTSLSHASRVWFTIGHGILDEVYYPRVDQACIRDLGLIVTDGSDFFSEEKRHTEHQVAYPVDGEPYHRLVNVCSQGRYRTEKEILADPRRDVVLQRVKFVPLRGELLDYHLYVLLAPHLGNRGSGNTAWTDDYKGVPMLFAKRGGYALALACSHAWLKRSVGFVGRSDGWQDLHRHKEMTWTYDRAENGNVALTGEVDLRGSDGSFVVALGFGLGAAEAGLRARASLLGGFEASKAQYAQEWQAWHNDLLSVTPSPGDKKGLYQISATTLRVHEAKRFPGGIIASLSIPWGFAKGDDDLGGYHLVWPRDLAETAGGLLAAGAADDACRVVEYLRVTQEADGHWPQNMWMDGTPYWSGVQMDETAFPILLVDLALREDALEPEDMTRLWPMIRRAAGYLVRNGPVTQQDRWEEDAGYSPFTLAVEIAALVCAAELADSNGEAAVATYLRETADAWNANIERWTYVTGTELADRAGVAGYYVRIAPPSVAEAASPLGGFVPIKNRPPGESTEPATQVISPDALALVRFGLRAPDDPRIVDTVAAIDAVLKVDTPYGPCWHRYDDDGYGEHHDGSPFDGTGVGRAWPLLTGERAHYELAAGRRDDAEQLTQALEAFSNDGGMIPEQIWDAPDIPSRGLFRGRPTGSAMPLVWAHAEYIKLRRSLQEQRVFDMPPQSVQRYVTEGVGSPHSIWRFNEKSRELASGQIQRVETLAPAVVRWSIDGWETVRKTNTRDTGLGVHVADLPTDDLPAGTTLVFTFYWPEADREEGQDFTLQVVDSSANSGGPER